MKTGNSGSGAADENPNPEQDESFQKSLKKYYKSSFGISVDAEYEIRGLYSGEWQDLFPWVEETTESGTVEYIENWDALAPLKVAGTTVILRQKAINQEYKKNEDGSFVYDSEGNKQIEEEGMPAGVEVKIKIPASPKAPKATIDYGKGTIKFPKNVQYGIIDNRIVEYVDASAGGAFTPGEILEAIADKLELKDNPKANNMERTNFIQDKIKKGFCLIVRTNDSKKGKSNVKFVTVKPSPVITDDGWGKLFNSEGKEIATYEFKGETGIVLTFADEGFQYEENGRWKKVISDRVIKGKDQELTVRLAGVRNKDESIASWPSEKIKLEKRENKGKVEFPEDATTVAAFFKDGYSVKGEIEITVQKITTTP